MWYEFEDAEPIAVMRCVCGQHPNVDEDGVGSGLLRATIAGAVEGYIGNVIDAWDAMVDSGE